MREICVKRLMDILEKAGTIALELVANSAPELKADQSVVTRADKAISVLATQMLQDFLVSGEHLLIDEEDAGHERALNDAVLDAQPYIWALDPIDGTRPYANGVPYFGISLGVLKQRRPWIGGVLFPMLDELFYCDGERAYFVKHPFSEKAVSVVIAPQQKDFGHQSIFYCTDGFFKFFRWESKDCHLIVPACAVTDLCWPAIGRGCGCLFRANLWDFAGAWPIYQRAGLELRSYSEGKVLDRLDLADYRVDRSSWKLREFHILSTEQHFPQLKSRLVSF